MTWTPIDLQPGLDSDDTPFVARGRFREASNIQFRKGKAEVTKGWERFYVGEVPGVVRNVLPWKDILGVTNIGMGTHVGLQIYKNGSLFDATPDDLEPGYENTGVGPGYGIGAYGLGVYGRSDVGNYYARTWAMANWGQDLMAVPRGGPLCWWKASAPTTKATYPANAPTVSNYMLVTPQRQILLLGTEQELDGIYNPMCIRGSDLENPEVWSTAADNNAFEHILEGSGRIIGARLFDDGVIVWTESRCFKGTFLGAPGQTYRFDEIHGASGLLAPNAAAVTGTGVVWMSPDKHIYMISIGGTGVVPIVCPVFDDSLGDFIVESQLDKVVLSFLRENNELRIDYPDLRDGRENSRYLLLNMTDGSWSRGTQARSAMDAGITNPIGMMPVQRFEDDVALDYKFQFNQDFDVESAGGTLTPGLESITYAEDVAGAKFETPDIAVEGDIYRYIEIDVERIAQRTEGAWRGVAYYKTADHGYSDSFRSQPVGDIAVGERKTLRFDMGNLQYGGEDYRQSEIIQIGIALDDGPGGQFLVRSFRVYGDPVQALTRSIAYYHERGTNADGGEISWFVDTNYFTLDEDERMMLVRGFKPDFKDQVGTVKLTLFFKDDMGSLDEDEEAYGPYDVARGDTRVDFFASGKLARFRLEGKSVPASLRLGRCLFDVVPMGTE